MLELAESRFELDKNILFRLARVADEAVAWLKTLAFRRRLRDVARDIRLPGSTSGRPEHGANAGGSRLPDVVDKAADNRWIGEPHVGDIVMLYYPNKPEQAFVKRVIAKEGDTVRIVAGKVTATTP